jgi:hypothetical protein
MIEAISSVTPFVAEGFVADTVRIVITFVVVGLAVLFWYYVESHIGTF